MFRQSLKKKQSLAEYSKKQFIFAKKEKVWIESLEGMPN